MKKRRFMYGVLVLFGMLFFQFAGAAHADILLVTPEKAVLTPGEGQQFHAQLFSEHAVPAPMGLIKWKVMPDTLGTITDDGYFVAGDHPGEGEILAVLPMGGVTIRATARVIITKKKLPLRLEIFPEKKVVQIGDTLKFKVRASSVGNIPLSMLSFNWFVKPKGLAEISQRGVLVVKKYGMVTVVAFTEFLGQRYKVEAKVYVTPEMSGAITGIVRDEDSGSPLIGARVEAYRIGKHYWSRVARTDSLGNYELNNLLPGYYIIFAKKNDYISEFYKDVRYLREAKPVQVGSADTVSAIDFNLNHGSVLKGTVWTEGDSTALRGANVKATLVVNPLIRYHCVSDDTGTFRMIGIPTGTYILSVDKEGFEKEYFDNTSDPKNATSISVTEPDSVENINFTLETKSAITGQVLSATTSEPLAMATVFAVHLTSNRFAGHWARHTKTDRNGNFVLSVPAGNYIVGAVAEGFGVKYFDNVAHMNEATPVKVEDGLHTTGIDFSLDPLASISGVVTSASAGAPIAHATVEAFPETWIGKKPYRVRTGEDGTFTIPNVRPGIYVIKAKAKGYLPEYYQEASRLKDATLVKIDLNQSVTGIDFTLGKSAIIAGKVTDSASGNPILHGVVLAKKLNSAFSLMSMTKEDGTFSIENLQPGKYIVSAIARGYHREFYQESASRDSADVLEIADSDSLGNIDFTLDHLPVQGGISGLVFSDADSLPIGGAWVMAFPKNAGHPFLTVTGSDGAYAFTDLHSGQYFVMAWARGFVGEFYDDVRNWKKATIVSVTSPNVTTDIDFGLAPVTEGTYTIAGKIENRSGKRPLDHVFVYARGQMGMTGFAVTDENGLYAIMNLPAGHYRIFGIRPGYWQSANGDTSTSDSLDATVGSGESYDNANISMSEISVTGVQNSGNGPLPSSYALNQNYPNPFNPETTISYAIPQAGLVSVNVYDLLGQKIVTLENSRQAAGVYTLRWNGRDAFGAQVSSGIYFVKIQVKNSRGVVFRSVKKMTLMK